ncbi:hypothetical protein NST58_23185 [Paenibacillus sp. FSL R10-2796]|uniref:hypothetical protein n=1 Tax=Paenibacillus sp. FSL R10-2796 TaxID=2954663 RepID=UPI0030DC29AE
MMKRKDYQPALGCDEEKKIINQPLAVMKRKDYQPALGCDEEKRLSISPWL